MATSEQIRRRGRWSLVLGTIIVSGLLAAVSWADTIAPDADVVAVGNQASRSLGVVSAGATLTPPVSFELQCAGSQHVDNAGSVTVAYSSSASTIPSDGGMTATSATIGPIPSAWPDDTSNCGASPPTPIQDNGNSTVTITAPTAPGTYNFIPKWNVSAPESSDVTGTGPSVTFTLTVPADTTAPTGSITINADAAYANSASATLNLAAADAVGVTAYRVANGSSCSGATYVSVTWATAFSLDLPHSLPAGDGSKTVCAQYKDAAGIESATYTDSIVLDTSAPTISNAGVQSGTTGSNGWYTSAVTNRFTASDAGSGLNAACQAAFPSGNRDVSTGSSEGTSVTVSSGPCTDLAGNTNAGISSATFKIDLTGPSAALSVTAGTLGSNGWYTSNVTVHTAGTDSISSPVTCTGDQFQTTETSGQLFNGSCTNDAGLTTNSSALTIKLDKTKPSIVQHDFSPAANGAGWHNSDITVRFKASDALSGLNAACETAFPNVSGDRIQSKLITTEGSAVTVDSDSCTDLAGNTAAAKTSDAFKLDKTAPTASANAAPAPNGNGWNNTNVTVTFTGNDGLSGIASCDPPVVLSSEGAGQSASGTCTDVAGNPSATATASGINIDKTAPTLTWSGGPANGSSHYFGSVPSAPTCGAVDALSGPDTCLVSGYGTTVGAHTMTATAKDKAGNTHSEQRSYTVLAWTLKGFYQPVDMNGVFNTVKNGSTVPLKFEIFAGPTELTNPASVKSLTSAEINCDASAPQDEVETVATGGTSLRYDSTGGQFIYNWKTPSTAGKCSRVTMTSQDGSSLVAFFKLK